VDPAKEEEILRVTLELAFRDDPTPRREGDGVEGGEGGGDRRTLGLTRTVTGRF